MVCVVAPRDKLECRLWKPIAIKENKRRPTPIEGWPSSHSCCMVAVMTMSSLEANKSKK